MKAFLLKQGLWDAMKLKSELPATVMDEDLKEVMEKAHSTMTLCVGDKALREVVKETTTRAVWDRLESLYMVKPWQINCT